MLQNGKLLEPCKGEHQEQEGPCHWTRRPAFKWVCSGPAQPSSSITPIELPILSYLLVLRLNRTLCLGLYEKEHVLSTWNDVPAPTLPSFTWLVLTCP